MGYYAEQIQEAATKLGVQVQLLTKREIDLIREQLGERYTRSKTRIDPYDLEESNSFHDPSAWTWLTDILSDEPVIIFFYPRDDAEGYRIPSGKLVTPLLRNCTGFPFFLTDPQLSFVICFEEHDCLLVIGTEIMENIKAYFTHDQVRSPSKKSCSE